MLQKNKGFTLIELIATSTLLFTSILLLLPLFILVSDERELLYSELDIIGRLEKQLHTTVNNNEELPTQHKEMIHELDVSYVFTRKDKLVKGCVLWETKQKNEKIFCLYHWDS